MMKKFILTLTLSSITFLMMFVSIYVGNLNSYKFHYQGCRWGQRIHESNRYYSDSRQELIDLGMIPCKVCRP